MHGFSSSIVYTSLGSHSHAALSDVSPEMEWRWRHHLSECKAVNEVVKCLLIRGIWQGNAVARSCLLPSPEKEVVHYKLDGRAALSPTFFDLVCHWLFCLTVNTSCQCTFCTICRYALYECFDGRAVPRNNQITLLFPPPADLLSERRRSHLCEGRKRLSVKHGNLEKGEKKKNIRHSIGRILQEYLEYGIFFRSRLTILKWRSHWFDKQTLESCHEWVELDSWTADRFTILGFSRCLPIRWAARPVCRKKRSSFQFPSCFNLRSFMLFPRFWTIILQRAEHSAWRRESE